MIIGISGKIGSGKDTIGKIINALYDEDSSDKEIIELAKGDLLQVHTNWKIKKFADKLKDIVCLLIGCTREQLEDRDFKEKKLGEDWIRYGYADGFFHLYHNSKKTTIMNNVECSKERYEEEHRINWQTAYKHEYSVRDLLQLIGTELFRNKLLNNIWVNALFAEYKPNCKYFESKLKQSGNYECSICEPCDCFPNWIITDIRFPNEAQAIKDRGGLLIRVNRDWRLSALSQLEKTNTTELLDNHLNKPCEHPSETALDDYQDWDYVIDNNGSIEELIEKVKDFLTIKLNKND